MPSFMDMSFIVQGSGGCFGVCFGAESAAPVKLASKNLGINKVKA